DGSFQSARTLNVGAVPRSVVLGDLNGDGLLDLAVVVGNAVSVLLGNGDGTFQNARSFTTGFWPRSVALGDLNGDGLLDLAVANYGAYPSFTGSVSVLLGYCEGAFQNARQFPAGIRSQSVAVRDLNGDGLLDLIVTNEVPNGTVSVLLGNGDGSFQNARNFAAGTRPRSVAVGDVNGDGALDLAVANYNLAGSGTASVLLGNGDGSFQKARNFTPGALPNFVALDDVNGDGLLDLIVPAITVRVLLGNGDGTFQNTHVSHVAGNRPWSAVVGDFNGDGLPDLAVANVLSNDVSILLN